MDNFLINFGDAVKVLDESTGRIGGHCILFGSPEETDLVSDFFTSSCDYDLYEGKSVPVLFEHGMDPQLGKTKLGRASLKLDDVGVWFESVIEARSAYVQKILEMVKEGALGISSGAVSHLVERVPVKSSYEVKSWYLSEISLTPTPCEPRTNVQTLKSYQAILQGLTQPPPAPSTSHEGGRLYRQFLQFDAAQAMARPKGY